MDAIPLACTLSAGELAGRLDRWHALGARALLRSVHDAGTATVAYRPSDDVFAELTALAEAERDCCAFIAWHVERDGEEVRLVVSAAPGTRAEDAQAILAIAHQFASTVGPRVVQPA